MTPGYSASSLVSTFMASCADVVAFSRIALILPSRSVVSSADAVPSGKNFISISSGISSSPKNCSHTEPSYCSLKLPDFNATVLDKNSGSVSASWFSSPYRERLAILSAFTAAASLNSHCLSFRSMVVSAVSPRSPCNCSGSSASASSSSGIVALMLTCAPPSFIAFTILSQSSIVLIGDGASACACFSKIAFKSSNGAALADACRDTTPTVAATAVLPNHFLNLLMFSSYRIERCSFPPFIRRNDYFKCSFFRNTLLESYMKMQYLAI